VTAIIVLSCITAAAQSVTTLYSFNRTDGQLPSAALVRGSDGNFYGTTVIGGMHYQGTVFSLSLTVAPAPLKIAFNPVASD